MWVTTKTLVKEIKKEQEIQKEVFDEMQAENHSFYELLNKKVSVTDEKVDCILQEQTNFYKKCDCAFERLFLKLDVLETKIFEKLERLANEIGKTEDVIVEVTDKSNTLSDVHYRETKERIGSFEEEIISMIQDGKEILSLLHNNQILLKSGIEDIEKKALPEIPILITQHIRDSEKKQGELLKGFEAAHKELSDKVADKLETLETKIFEKNKIAAGKIESVEELVAKTNDKMDTLSVKYHEETLEKISNLEREISFAKQHRSELFSKLRENQETLKDELENIEKKTFLEVQGTIANNIKESAIIHMELLKKLNKQLDEISVEVVERINVVETELLEETKRTADGIEQSGDYIREIADKINITLSNNHEKIVKERRNFEKQIISEIHAEKDILLSLQNKLEAKIFDAFKNSMERAEKSEKSIVSALQTTNGMIKNENEDIQKNALPRMQKTITDCVKTSEKNQAELVESMKVIFERINKNLMNNLEEAKKTVSQARREFLSVLEDIKEDDNVTVTNIEVMNRTLQEVTNSIMALDEGNRLIIARMLLNDLEE